MTEQSVKRKITGRFAVKKRAYSAACIVFPFALIIAGIIIRDFAVLIAFAAVSVAAVPFEIFFYHFFFRVEYDYSLVEDVLSISVIRNRRYGFLLSEIPLRDAEEFRPFSDWPRERPLRRSVFCGDDELSDGLWEIRYREPDAALPDVVVFAPDERLVREIKKFVR